MIYMYVQLFVLQSPPAMKPACDYMVRIVGTDVRAPELSANYFYYPSLNKLITPSIVSTKV